MCSTPNSFIKNSEIPPCLNCIYYKPSITSGDFASSLSECTKFAEKDIITGEIKNEFVSTCRRDENMCGKRGKYFEEEPNIGVKIASHKIQNITPGILLFTCLLFYTYLKTLYTF
jgi:hypothetical protein